MMSRRVDLVLPSAHNPSVPRNLALGAAAVATLLFNSANSLACGETPNELKLLLPANRAVDVPLNVALSASSNTMDSAIVLKKVDDDGATTDVPVNVDCLGPEYGGAVCLARPEISLEPDSQYQWTASLAWDRADDPAVEVETRTFTTGDAIDQYALHTDDVGVHIATHEEFPNGPCVFSVTHLFWDGANLADPVVVNLKGLTPSYTMHAQVLSAGDAIEFLAYDIEDCVSPEVFDQTGHRMNLGSVCLASDTEESEGKTASCSLSVGHVPSSPWLIVLTLLGALRIGRRASRNAG